MSALQSITPLPQTRRGWIAVSIVGVVLVVAFVLVVTFYKAEGGITVEGGVPSGASGGLIVTLQPLSVDATRENATIHFVFTDQGSGLIDENGKLTKNVRITIGSGAGISEFSFPEGTALGQLDVVIGLNGEAASYPFDSHEAVVTVAADTYTMLASGGVGTSGDILVGLQGEGGVNGWDTTMVLSDGLVTAGEAAVTFDRAFSTQAFTALIVSVAGILALLALSVGVLVQTGKRPAEAALLSWTAALLFALPALRNYLPNGPPFGASIDMYVYLWIMAAAGFAAVLVVLGWNGQRSKPNRD
jgi:Domain of unknown function (DUF4436)